MEFAIIWPQKDRFVPNSVSRPQNLLAAPLPTLGNPVLLAYRIRKTQDQRAPWESLIVNARTAARDLDFQRNKSSLSVPANQRGNPSKNLCRR